MNFNQTIFSSATLLVSIPLSRREIYNVCMDQPMKIISDGIWNHPNGSSPAQSAYTMLQIQMVIIFAITQAFHFILKQFGFPYFVSQVMAGFLLGPTIPTGPFEKYKKMLFPFGSADILNTVSSLGFSFFLFITSVQMDLSLITKTGKKAWVMALSSYFVSIAIGFSVMNLLSSQLEQINDDYDSFSSLPMVIVTQGGVSFAVVSTLLNDLGILNSELGRLALSTAFVNDLTGGIAAGFGADYVKSVQLGFPILVTNVVAFFVYLICIPLIGRPAMKWIVKNTPEGKPVSKIYIYSIIVSFLGLGFFAGYFNQPFLVGAIILGLAVPEGPPLGSELVSQLELFCSWFLTSIFVTCCTMKVDLKACVPLSFFVVVFFFILLAQLIKILLCMGICRYCKMPYSDGFCLALILSSKGVVDVCSYVLMFDSMAQNKQVIGVLIVSVLVLGTTSKIGVKALYDPSRKYAGYQKRNIMSLKQNHELRIVACIQKTYQVIHMKNVLQLCSPCPENTLVADILHLMELVGRSTPIFIAHRLQQKVGSSYNYSGELIVTFDLFERDYAGCATANTYTAISPMALMHEDVCHLALDKNAAIIILPFHLKWGGDGSIELEDNNIRSFNSRVLERAPCSIGILVSRGPAGFSAANYKVAMVFLGGADDREALCLAKRFTKNLGNRLFVYRLVAYDRDMSNWEDMIDDEELREVRGAYGKLENVTYEEHTIEDASQTTVFIKDIANKFDFIMVGRRYGMRSSQTYGLENWTEYSELGVIGDLLASPDMETRASVLVVQQQSTAVS
ncbi:Cation/H(+) antiporter 4 Protein [Vigna angularis]|nr:cation/H(+) antiporter 4 [Vigna angularis]KAG2394632.1 Cation/H(+) antiporter 4 Protein [Vigna angularis]